MKRFLILTALLILYSEIFGQERDRALVVQGALRKTPEASGSIIYIIPTGTIRTYGYENGYYIVYYNGERGYMNEVLFSELNDENTENSSVKLNENSSTKQYKVFYKDGVTYENYKHNGISVTMRVNIERNYGKYYIAYIEIQNNSGDSFNFNPEDITAVLNCPKGQEDGVVLSVNDYMEIVGWRQLLHATVVAFAEFNAANQDQFDKNSARITAIQNTNDFMDLANQRADIINQGYLKLNTIDDEQGIFGQINIKFKPYCSQGTITVPINGELYDFSWAF